MNNRQRENSGYIILICIFLLFLAGFLSSCSPEKRLSKLLKKYPRLMQIDSVIFQDTFLVESERLDTALAYRRFPYPVIITDTIEKERLQIIVRQEIDSIRITGECLPDTIIKDRVMSVEKKIITSRHDIRISIIIAVLACLILVAIIRAL